MSARRTYSSLAVLALACIVTAQDTISMESYIRPPKHIEEAVLAPWYKNRSITNLSPDRTKYIYSEREGMPPLALLARPHLNLGGIQIDREGGRARNLTTRSAASFNIVQLESGVETSVAVPKDAQVSGMTWSPDGKSVAYLAHFPNRSEIWVADSATGRTRAVTTHPALPILATNLEWTDDSRSIIAVMAPNGRKPAPQYKPVADTPRVLVADDKPTRLRTYMGLMSSPTDQELLEYYGTGQLALVDASNGRVTAVGQPAMIEAFNPMPDGKYFRVTVMEKPFSYLFPASMFPERELLWDSTGKELQVLRKRGAPGEPTPPTPPTGNRGAGRGAGQDAPPSAEKRGLTWMPDGRGLVYLQTQGQGSQAKDRVVLWKPPFGDADVETLYETGDRVSSVRFGPDVKTLFITHTVSGRSRVSMVKPGAEPVMVYENRPNEESVDLLTTAGPKTGSVIRVSSDGKFAYLAGSTRPEDNLKEAPRPFLERVELANGKREQIWQSSAEMYETASALDDDLLQMLVSRQSPSMVPQTFLVTRGSGEKQLTKNVDYVPDLTQAKREFITVTRNDGIQFRVKVTLPRYHVPYAKSPAFFWFYPREYTDQSAYDRSTRGYNKNLFSQVGGSNKAIMLRAGYVLVEPDCPIIGPSERKNDAFVPQLRNNLAATIDALDRLGYVDRQRLALGGHSYGAFSTANAMVHTPFFKAGIAGAGNYNRSLTPFGFQSDQRQIWESREVYLSMSPILWAENMSGAMLMYHGAEDQNMGTNPINSERMFAALEALGKPTALYMYPYEDHGQIAEETVLDQWARWVAWLDKYVKDAK